MAFSATALPVTDDTERRLQLQQLEMALRNLKPNYWMMPVFGAVTCAMFATWVDHATLALWFAIVVAGSAAQFATGFAFTRAPRPPETARKWRLVCTAGYAAFALSWATMGLFLWQPSPNFGRMVIMLLLACTLAGNTALTGPSRPMTVAGLLTYGGALIVLPLREGGSIYDGLAVMSGFYVAYLAHLSRSIHDTARNMLKLRDDKNGLIEALAQSKAVSDEARERAESASQAKSEFLANMSHELRTPLNAILGFSEMIHSGALGPDPARDQEYAKIIHDSGHHLLALINDMLDLAKIESGRLTLRDDEVDLCALIADCTRLMGNRAKESGVALSVDVATGLPTVTADGRALKQVLLNLISNAVKFTPPGGQVHVFALRETVGTIAFGVRDTGIGIALEDQARVFEHFGQGRHDVVTSEKGTGLGLPIVKGLMEAHGGSVDLSSTVGEGTLVIARLPAERVRPQPDLRKAG